MLTIVLDKDLECTIVYVRCDSGYDGYHETHLIVTVYSELVPSRFCRQNEDKAAELETSICDVKYHVSLALSMIPMGSSGDVSRRFTMIRWPPLPSPTPLSAAATKRRRLRGRTCSDHLVEEIPFVTNSSALLVQIDEGDVFPVVDRIRRCTTTYR
ncbi:hypothetical protein F511_40812 [Dorcoceras hygrometricum]|uniref:Uncharacterized protein n=1 Tax=Dorcoceras hygrometricum TaxID=472368 RepID=A0A2Z7DI50_9LAMI|nr:hypothetical protein F511_40812 [Dorcoceras hygrometricum]